MKAFVIHTILPCMYCSTGLYPIDFPWLRSPCSFVDAFPHGVESLRVLRPCELDVDEDELPIRTSSSSSAQRAADLIFEERGRETGVRDD